MGSPTRQEHSAMWVGQTLRGKYRIARVLGEGGCGVVLEAEHLQLRRPVAIKVLHPHVAANPRFVERFRREALAASRIGHPNIVDVLDLDRTDEGLDFMVLELLQGEDLGARLEREGHLSFEDAMDILVPVAQALLAAHDAGIIHRDLKPENVFLAQRADGSIRPKVVDFGVAKIESDVDEMRQSVTQTGVLIGTPLYMPPEQLRGEKTIDHRADLYSYGVMLYESLAGVPPFLAENFPALVTKILFEEPPSLLAVRPDVPLEVDGLVRVLLKKEPDDRPSSFVEVIAVFDELRRDREAADHATTSGSGSMDEVVDDIDTIVMKSPLSGESDELSVRPTSGEMPRVQTPASGERFVPVRAAAPAPALSPAPGSMLRAASREATPSARPAPGTSSGEETARTGRALDRYAWSFALALAFVTIAVLTYWIVVSL